MSPAPSPIGTLRHRVMLERSGLAADGSTLWTPIAPLFAALRPTGAGETDSGGGLAGRVTHTVEIRWRDDVTSRDRLTLGGRVFRVLAVRDLDETRRRLLIHAEEEGR